MSKKSYNPFKMWGSYVGVIGGFLISLLSLVLDILENVITPMGINFKNYVWYITPSYLLNYIILPIQTTNYGVYLTIIFIFNIIIGFFLGYGIHSLFRAMRR